METSLNQCSLSNVTDPIASHLIDKAASLIGLVKRVRADNYLLVL